MLKRIRKIVAPPIFENDEDKTRAAALLNTILWSQLALLTVLNTVYGLLSLLGGQTPANLFISFVAMAMFAVMLVLVHRGFVRGISYLLAFSITGIILFSIATSPTVTASTLSGLLIPVMMAGLFTGWRGTVVVTAVNLLALSSLGYFYEQGWVVSPPLPATDLISFGAISTTSALLLGMASRSIQEALTRARHDQQELSALAQSLEQRVTDRTRVLSAVAEISSAASTILETDKLLQHVVDLTKERFNFYHAHIYLLNEQGDTLVLASGAGEPGRHMVAEGRSIPLDREQSLVARAARERKGVTINDVTTEPDFLPNPFLPDTHSELAVPMIVGENVIGVFDVQSEVIGRFTDADIAVQTTLASQVASAVQNARLYARAETIAQEAQSLVDHAPEAITAVDLTTGLFVNPNENAIKLYGLPREELVKVGPAQMSPPTQPNGRDSAQAAMEKIGEAMQGGTPIFEWMHRNGQGEDFLCEVRLVRMPGEQPRVRASVTDITERKRNEDLTRLRAQQQEALNLITQKIQSATTIEAALQVTARELGRALGHKPTLVALEPVVLESEIKKQ